MHIGIDARMYGPRQTGIGNYIKYLVTSLQDIDKGNRYTLFMRDKEYTLLTLGNPRFSKVKADIGWYSLAEQTSFLKLLLRHPVDLMHFPHFNVPLLYHKPFVVTIHDLTPKLFPGEKVGKSLMRRLGYRLVLRHAVKGSRAIIAPSAVIKDDIIRNFAISEHNVHVIYEGIPLPPKGSGKTPLKGPYILYVGVWRSHKNVEGLLHAFARLKAEGLPHTLVLVGDPDIYWDTLQRVWKGLGITKWVVAAGFQPDEALEDWYAYADLVVLPSFSEGFGFTPLIARSYGIPVAVSDIPVLWEILGKEAVYFNPYDPRDMATAMMRALKGPRRTPGIKGLRNDYRWDTMAAKTLALYQASVH